MLKWRINRKTDNIFTKAMWSARQVSYSFPCRWRHRNIGLWIRSIDDYKSVQRFERLADNGIRLLQYLLYLDASISWSQSEIEERYKVNDEGKGQRYRRKGMLLHWQHKCPIQVECRAKRRTRSLKIAAWLYSSHSGSQSEQKVPSFLPCASSAH